VAPMSTTSPSSTAGRARPVWALLNRVDLVDEQHRAWPRSPRRAWSRRWPHGPPSRPTRGRQRHKPSRGSRRIRASVSCRCPVDPQHPEPSRSASASARSGPRPTRWSGRRPRRASAAGAGLRAAPLRQRLVAAAVEQVAGVTLGRDGADPELLQRTVASALAPRSRIRARRVFGNAMTSRMFSSPQKMRRPVQADREPGVRRRAVSGRRRAGTRTAVRRPRPRCRAPEHRALDVGPVDPDAARPELPPFKRGRRTASAPTAGRCAGGRRRRGGAW